MLAGIYAQLAVFLYAPLADNCPLVVLEALACGVPIVSFGVGGIPELMDNGQEGFLVPPCDSTALVEKTAKLLSNTDLRQHIALRARERALKQFDHRKTAAQYVAVYNCCRERYDAS
ncbi:MAG: glycosyltransferase [Desulfobacteraceae bacterium]|nr:MAG: glycosyltransferase [Desulfobacteraceae bacterium]